VIALRRNTLAWIPGFLLLSLYLLGTSARLSAAETQFILEESLPLNLPAYTYVIAVNDMDRDDFTNVLTWSYAKKSWWGGTTKINKFSILERTGNDFVPTWFFNDSAYRSGPLVGDLDGDGRLEFTSAPWGVIRVLESSGDDTYTIHQNLYVGTNEGYTVGDHDGDGLLELIVGEESRGVRIFESSADNQLKQVAHYPGSIDICVAGTYDLDGDGAPETVFSDRCATNTPPYGQLNVYEDGKRVCCDFGGIFAKAVGDSDRNGLGEIIGYSPIGTDYSANWRILESTGTGNSFVEVMKRPTSTMNHSLGVADYDGDGFQEHLGLRKGPSGNTSVFVLAQRVGDQLIDFYNSADLFQAFDGDIKTVRIIEPGKLAVVQGNYLHLLSVYRNIPPVAVAGNNIEIIVGETAFFDGSGSYDEDGNIVDYQWLIGNDIVQTGEQPNYLFVEPGVHTVTLTVTDNEGATASDMIGVSVLSPAVAMYVLMARIAVLELPKGIETSLTTKVAGALDAIDNSKSCANKLGAFINQVNALEGKKLAADEAGALNAYASRIIAAL
jgi:hypothetical protein